MKKRFSLILLAALQMFLLSGCWNYVEIDQQINVSGIALDVGRGGKRLHLSVEIITVGKSEESRFESHVLESEGNTVFEAIRELMGVASRRLYFGHCKLLIFGEDLARNGIREYLDLPLRNHELRTTMDVIIAKGGSGRDILYTKGITTSIVSYRISDILRGSQKSVGCSAMAKDYQVYGGLETKGYDITIPAFVTHKVDEEDVACLCGAGVFDGDRLIGWLTKKECALLSMVNGTYKTGLVTIEAAESPWKNTTFEVHKAKSETKVSIGEDESVTEHVHVKLWVNVGEAQTNIDFFDPAQTERNKYALEKNLEHDLNHLADAAQWTYRCDLFGVGKKIGKKDPAAWEKFGSDWKKRFSEVKFEIKVDAVIISGGVSGVSTE